MLPICEDSSLGLGLKVKSGISGIWAFRSVGRLIAPSASCLGSSGILVHYGLGILVSIVVLWYC